MTQDLSKIIAMASGQNRNHFDMDLVPVATREQIDTAFDNIFLGKSLLLWSKGGRLLDAWTSVLDTMRDDIFALPITSTIVEYLRIAIFQHRAKWQSKTIQSDERNAIATLDSQEKKEIQDHANTMIAAGQRVIDELLKDSTAHTPKATEHTLQQSRQQQMVAQKVLERTHSRERTRERH